MNPSTKPYVKLAYTLIIVGMGIFALERVGLSNMSGPNRTQMHLDGTLLSVLVLAPIVLVIAGCLIFMVGKMRRL
jgi:heme/copper-type cytochrome/quinol oxidase subunit 2